MLDDHLIHIQQVFDRLLNVDLKMNAKKCLLLREEVPYLGYIVSQKGYPDPSKVVKEKEYPHLQTSLRSVTFEGLNSITYYLRFAFPNCSPS